MNSTQEDISNLKLAKFSSRLLAYVIDDILITLVILLIFWDHIVQGGEDIGASLEILNNYLFPIIVLKVAYHTFFVWYYGATLGKIVAKIRVIDYNNFGKVSFSRSLLRAIGRIVSEMFFYLGFIFAFFDKGKQTFHGKIAKTLVVNA
ncbi:MAG: RDD family protein [Arcobacteraceae bacterium]|jgi:uncharacterized RDD family membrane protein YckC|nr:RDD family protein [Arcobacteraceae bacterium]